MPRQRTIKPEEPRCEPEILPPERGRRAPYQSPPFFAGHASERVFVARLGPWSFVGIALIVGLFAGVVLAMMLGTLLLAIPVVGLLIAGALISNALRARLRRFM
jgi:hypothetical protein